MAGPAGDWVIDTGATNSMSGEESHFQNLKDLHAPIRVQTAADAFIMCRQFGDIPIFCHVKDSAHARRYVIKNALYVPGIRRNLFSVSSAMIAARTDYPGATWTFSDDGVTFCEASGVNILHGLAVGKLYIFATVATLSATDLDEHGVVPSTGNDALLIDVTNPVALQRRHERLGHACSD